MSQSVLAEALGISQRSVSEIESGKPTIYARRMFDLLRATGIELTARWEDDDSP
jgi:HTH-type transcriptional regulator/antitoxin HipB